MRLGPEIRASLPVGAEDYSQEVLLGESLDQTLPHSLLWSSNRRARPDEPRCENRWAGVESLRCVTWAGHGGPHVADLHRGPAVIDDGWSR